MAATMNPSRTEIASATTVAYSSRRFTSATVASWSESELERSITLPALKSWTATSA